MIKVTVRTVGLLVCALLNWKLAAIGLLALVLIGERGQKTGLIPFPVGFRIIPEYGALALGIWAIYSLPYLPFKARVAIAAILTVLCIGETVLFVARNSRSA